MLLSDSGRLSPHFALPNRCTVRFRTTHRRREARLDSSHTSFSIPRISNLRKFHFSLWDYNPFPIMSELIKLQGIYCVLPLMQLCISGYGSAAYLPPSITLRSGTSCGSHTLTSLYISSDLPFAPGLVQTTMGILKQSPIKRLSIYMVSLNCSQWSTLLGQLNMTLLEDIEVEGDIPWPALIRFLIKHRGLRVIHVCYESGHVSFLSTLFHHIL